MSKKPLSYRRKPVFYDVGSLLANYVMFGVIWYQLDIDLRWLVPILVFHLILKRESTFWHEYRLKRFYRDEYVEYTRQREKKEDEND